MADQVKGLFVFRVVAAAFAALAFMIGAGLLDDSGELAHTPHLH